MSKSFTRFIVTYALLIIFCLCLVVPTYAMLYDQYMAQCLEESRAQLRNGLDTFAQDIHRLFLYMATFKGNEKNARISNLSGNLKPAHYWWLDQARADIQTGLTLFMADGMIAEFGVLYPNGPCVTSRRSYASYEDMYNSFFRCDGMTAQQWRSKLRDSADGKGLMEATQYVSFDTGTFTGITFVKRVESQLIFCVIYAEDILEQMVSDDLRGDAVVILHTIEGRLLAQSSVMQDGSYESVTYGNMSSGLRAEVAIPSALIKARVDGFRRLAIVSVGILVIAGAMLAILLAYRDSKPVRELAATARALGGIHGEPGAGNEYKEIEKTLRSMDDELLNMRKAMTEQERLIEAGVVERFLHGLVHTPEEVAAATRYFEPQPQEYCALMVRIIGADTESDARRNAERNIAARLLQNIDPRLKLHFSGIDKILVVLPVGAGAYSAPEDYQDSLRAIAAQMRVQYSIQGIFAVSDIFTSLESLPDACAQARHILRLYSGGLGKEILFKSDLSDEAGAYIVGFIEMQRFYELLSIGSSESAETFIRNVFSCIRNHGYIAEPDLAQTLLSFRQAFDRVRAEIPNLRLEPFPALDDTESLDRIEERILSYTAEVCRRIVNLRGSEENDFTASVIAYINARISDPALCVASVADEFSLPERRLQALMRKATKRSFFDYVETRRMEMAHQLLRETDMPVNDIAAACGFTLANSFYKAFKRRYGTPPSVIREEAPQALERAAVE